MIIHYHSLSIKGDILPGVWNLLNSEKTPPWLWGNGPQPTLSEFVLYFSDPNRHLFLVTNPESNDCHGIIWIDEVVLTLRARAHMYFFQSFRGSAGYNPVDACQETLRILARPPFSLCALFFFTDDRAIMLKNFARKRMGVTYVTSLPYYYPATTVSVGYLSLEGYRESISSEENAHLVL